MDRLVDDRYRVIEPLGRGGMAEVFLARDEVLGRDVALKAMRRQYADEEEFVERFRREAENAAALSHPNIVAIHERGETGDGTHYIAMEYVPGGTLKDLVQREGCLPVRRPASIAIQIVEALRVAPGRGIVPRDIKPQNVLLTASGNAKVADFGIAKAAATTITRTDFVLGSAYYRSRCWGKGTEDYTDPNPYGVPHSPDVEALRRLSQPRQCRECYGRGAIRCRQCNGTGRI